MVTFASGKPSKSSLASQTLVFIALTVPVNGSDFMFVEVVPSLRLSRWSLFEAQAHTVYIRRNRFISVFGTVEKIR